MKKAYEHTRVSVKLRKSETLELWSLYLEAYPVVDSITKKNKRVREYLTRTITTPTWDKTREARTAQDGSSAFKPKPKEKPQSRMRMQVLYTAFHHLRGLY